MSFSSEVKHQLCAAPLEPLSCVRAEAYGVLLFCNSFSPLGVRIITQSPDFAQRLPVLFHAAFGAAFDEQAEPAFNGGKYTFRITNPAVIQTILELYGYSREQLMSHHINYAALEEPGCHAAFCRGAFLAGGSVTDPVKSYHLELSTNHLHVHRELQALIPELGLFPRETTRKSNYITYLKQSEAIAAFLTAIGAPGAAETIAAARREKRLRNGVNRQYNCDVANVDKSVLAAQLQIDAIHRLAGEGKLDSLPDKLRETALLRVEHPELSLAQLAALCQPPVSKSCLNHRLRKLQALAET